MTFDPDKLTIGPRPKSQTILRVYIDLIANQGLLPYKNNAQHGGKQGQALYTHILNGIMLLDTLGEVLALSEDEIRLLFTTYTVHDINKDPDYDATTFAQIAVPDNFADLIHKVGLEQFFPNYEIYFQDVVALARDHGAHSSSLATLGAWPLPSGLLRERLGKLLSLIRAVDIIDLSHTLDERKHKADFLSNLNNFSDDQQFTFYLHRLSENRGTLSNLIHNALTAVLKNQGAIPLLYYPDGVGYLIPRRQSIEVNRLLLGIMAKQCAKSINDMTSNDFRSFIKSGIHGIKVDPKCLELGISFENILNEIEAKVQKRNLNREELQGKIIVRTNRTFAKQQAAAPDAAMAVRTVLDQPDMLLPAITERLRDGELVRSYYIFLQSHLKNELPDPWEHIYDLFNVPADTRSFLNYFDARWDRPYVFMNHITHSYSAIYTTLEADGMRWLETNETSDDKADLFLDYLSRYALFGPMGHMRMIGNNHFHDHLHQYIATQHKQCVHCSTVFSTDKWMTNDVRSDITVQTFSNRLRGGPGEPKKNICRLCQLQFLVERLNYEEVRGEKTMYLHLFPYSFLTAPYLAALRENIDNLRHKEETIRAVWCDTRAALLDETKGIDPDFAVQTKAGKPHPFGLYLHRTHNTIGNRLIFPINPAGDNNSQRFLFALWLAIVIQKHMGLKVLLSESPTAPLIPEATLYIDNIALSCRGLVDKNEYAEFANLQDRGGQRPLKNLRQKARALHRIADGVRVPTNKKDEILALVQAMAVNPLAIFYTTEKLLEARVREQKTDSPEWLEIRLSQQIFADVELLYLVQSEGGNFMPELSKHLQKLAKIASDGYLRNIKSQKKNSLMMPLDQVFQKISQRGTAFDDEALKATTIQDIFDHLERIAEEKYKPGKRKMDAITAFVNTFYRDIYHASYQGNRNRLLADEKMLRSAFLFYLRQQLFNKPDETEER